MTTRSDAPRLSLFRKYFLAFFIAVTVPLLANGASESWFGYHDYRATLYARLKIEAAAAASEIRGFLDGIRDQMGWAVQLPWTMDNTEAHRLDAWRLLRQIPAIVEFALVDGEGIERVRVSRIGQDEIDSGINRSDDPAVVGARTHRVWYGPVTLNRGSEPYMTLSVAGNRSSVGVAIAQVNLTLIWNAISAIRVGNNGLAFVLDSNAKLVAHPDLNRMLQGIDEVTNVRLRGVREAILASGGEPVTGEDFEGRAVIAAAAPVAGVDWLVVAEQPTSEAFAPIRAALQRTGLLLLGGSVLALALAYLLAGRMIRPIRLLKEGAAQIGAGRFHHKIDIATGDELELLADQFKQMAGELAVSHERSERIARLKRFLSPQVADIVERSEDGNLLDARRADVVVVFGDLRGFTNFSATTEPDEIMRVLAQYYEAVGENITRYEATLTHFAGDGLMILLNAPVPCADNPVLRAIRMAGSMQTSIQALIVKWRARGQPMGFGIGFAKGVATVGRVGYEGRHDYTAIGNVVNLASRLCAAAEDGQILLDPIAADDVAGAVSLNPLGKHTLKGFTEPIAVYAVARQGRVDDASTPPVGQLLP